MRIERSLYLSTTFIEYQFLVASIIKIHSIMFRKLWQTNSKILYYVFRERLKII